MFMEGKIKANSKNSSTLENYSFHISLVDLGVIIRIQHLIRQNCQVRNRANEIASPGIDNFFETLATIGYFAALTSKNKNQPAALVDLACCQVAALEGVAAKRLSLSTEHKNL
jgi:hypothetical protein